MKKKNIIRVSRLRKLYNIINHDEKLQSLIIVICCFGLMAVITLYVILFG
jgi:hypothetical protein